MSLPNLTFLDLSSNKLTEINNFSNLVHLKVLILSKNMISNISKSLDSFKMLDILDLHDNRIVGKLDFSESLKKL